MSSPTDPVALFKCLADETRARILFLVLQEGELCVCELTEALAESQPKISRHLALLRNGGLLQDRRQGQWVYYRLHAALPQWVADVLQSASAANAEWLSQNATRLAAMREGPGQAAALCGSKR